MKQVVEGSHAVSEAVRLARVEVISAYPITPQTHIVEALSEYCADGRLAARFITVESEHSALASVIGAASSGVRTFTATASHGLAYMHELLHWSAGARLPIVMVNVNRALAPGWNIWADQSDSLSQRDTGWIQFYCEDGQEALDTTLQAFRLAENVSLPVMVALDAFFLSHTFEPVDIPDQETVDRFLPPLTRRAGIDTQNPSNIGQITPPVPYMRIRRESERAMQQVFERFEAFAAQFEALFGRPSQILEAVACGDAEVVLVVNGTAASTCRQVITDLRAAGKKAGMLKLKLFRPFPATQIVRELGHVPKLAVVDRNFSAGGGGILAQEVKSALCNSERRPQVYSYIAGIGGCDITPELLGEIYDATCQAPRPPAGGRWMGLD